MQTSFSVAFEMGDMVYVSPHQLLTEAVEDHLPTDLAVMVRAYAMPTNGDLKKIIDENVEQTLQERDFQNPEDFFVELMDSLPKSPPKKGSNSFGFFEKYLHLFSSPHLPQSDESTLNFTMAMKKIRPKEKNGFPVAIALISTKHGESFCVNSRELKVHRLYFSSLHCMVNSARSLMENFSNRRQLGFCFPSADELIPVVLRNMIEYKRYYRED